MRSKIATSNTNWSQIVTSSKKHRGDAYAPFAFTEQGVAMLSSVLNSDHAIHTNIAIIRAFVAMCHYALTFAELSEKVLAHDKELGDIVEVLRWLGEENHARYETPDVASGGEHKARRENVKLKRWLLAAGIAKDITFHSYRHTYATLQLSEGTDIYTLFTGRCTRPLNLQHHKLCSQTNTDYGNSNYPQQNTRNSGAKGNTRLRFGRAV